MSLIYRTALPVVIIVAACALRIIAVRTHEVSSLYDDDRAIRVATNLIRHGTFGVKGIVHSDNTATIDVFPTATQMPVYVLLLAKIGRNGDVTKRDAYLCNIVFGVSGVIMTYLVMSGLQCTHATCLLSAGLVAVDPVLVMSAVGTDGRVVTAFLATCGMLCCIRVFQRPDIMRAFLGGVFLSLGCLTNVAFAGSCVLLMCVSSWFVGYARKGITVWCGGAAGALLCFTPWVYRNYETFDRVIPLSTSGGYYLWNLADPRSAGAGMEGKLQETLRNRLGRYSQMDSEMKADEGFYREAWRSFSVRPLVLVTRWGANVINMWLWLPQYMWKSVWLQRVCISWSCFIFGAALFGVYRTVRIRCIPVACCVAIGAGYVFLAAFGVTSMCDRVAVEPIVCILACLGVEPSYAERPPAPATYDSAKVGVG